MTVDTSIVSTMVKGDHKTYRITVYEDDGTTPYDLTGSKLEYSVKEDGVDDTALIYKTSDIAGEIDITVPASGVALINLIPSDTSSLTPKEYVFDIQHTSAASKINTPIIGKLIIKQDVTNA